MRERNRRPARRKGAVLVYAAFMMVVVFGFAAFSIDVGYMTNISTQLQSAADAAALAGAMRLMDGVDQARESAIDIAERNYAGAQVVSMSSSDIEVGVYDLTARTFTVNESSPNAVRATARVTNRPLFFAPVLGQNTFSTSKSAIAMLKPRDIAFVVDLSGSMNNDTEPCWATDAINDEYSSYGSNIGDQQMQNVYTDFGYGTYPGTLEWVGSRLGVSSDEYAYGEMTKDNGRLASGSIPSKYRISYYDSESMRKEKAYSWMIDYQIASVMPNAKPTPNSSTNYDYWEAYLDYIIKSQKTSSSKGVPRKGKYSKVTLPASQDSDQITDFGNPDSSMYPSVSSTVVKGFQNQIGYRTYVQFMMDWGRDRSPDVSNYSNASSGVGTKVPLSLQSPYCPLHSETTAGGSFLFPPRSQPCHALRRSLIAALYEIQTQNEGIASSLGDQVAIISFDALDSYHEPSVEVSLTADFTAAMEACARLQTVGDVGASTATESGLIVARDHIKSTSEGGMGRRFTSKVYVLLTDGIPNLYSSSSDTISTYMTDNPGSYWYGSYSYYNPYNAALYQSSLIKGENGSLYPVGVGLGCDYGFMDKVACINGTDTDGQAPRGSGNPGNYESVMTEIFSEIIKRPGVRLVN